MPAASRPCASASSIISAQLASPSGHQEAHRSAKICHPLLKLAYFEGLLERVVDNRIQIAGFKLVDVAADYGDLGLSGDLTEVFQST
jgi:hypothetical protein